MGIPVEADLANRRRTLAARGFGSAALDDAEERLVGSLVSRLAAGRPAQGPGVRMAAARWHRDPPARGRRAAARTRRGPSRCPGRAPPGSPRRLSGVSRRVRPSRGERKATPFSSDHESVGERGDLEAAAVREPGATPAGEAVQAAELRNARLFARSLVQVVGVGQQDLRTRRPQLVGGDAAHGAVGGDGHEGRRLDHAVRRGESDPLPPRRRRPRRSRSRSPARFTG